ncbi:MAG: hypothetical protein RLZZ15_2191 [Verrucomicrobiota bacterium]
MCPACRLPVKAPAKFCSECGTPLTSVVAPATTLVEQTGPGAIAMDGGVAAGKGGTAMRAALIHNYFPPANPSPAPTLPPSDAALLGAFAAIARSVVADCSKLVTSGLNVDREVAARLRLAQVYVGLETKTLKPAAGPRKTMELLELLYPRGESAPLSALEALFAPQASRIALVGDPGSGKSTLLQYVALGLADELLGALGEPRQLAATQVPVELRGGRRLPLRLALREFAAGLVPDSAGTSGDVEEFLLRQLRAGSHHAAVERLPEVLRRGLAFMLFDGLDEVPRTRVATVRAAIAAFAGGAYGKCRMVVTCRVKSYEKPGFRLESFPKPHEIAPLTALGRGQFVHAWYQEMEAAQPEFRGQGAGCATDLLGAIGTDRLEVMAGNPFFLTAMAALHQRDGKLPNTSAALMHQLVDSVLEESRKRGATAATPDREPELTALLKPVPDGAKQLRRRLEAIAYHARAIRTDHTSRLVPDDTLRAPAKLRNFPNRPLRVRPFLEVVPPPGLEPGQAV